VRFSFCIDAEAKFLDKNPLTRLEIFVLLRELFRGTLFLFKMNQKVRELGQGGKEMKH